ncbi:NfeD family protein [Qipengyuania sp. MTN3-11]|uniref:NfeD family protein n=1 Tax=Qipengyuania sp. MTN3-11 TaxID=3056557 RepID=UPI0036F2124F
MDGIEAYWIWFAVGLVLAGLEMVLPGVYLIWLAVAALVTGVIVLVSGPPALMQVVCFVFLALIAAFSAKRWLRDQPILSSDPLLNNRLGRLVGQTARVTEAIEAGSGRVRVGDGEWLARGPDLAVGDRVRIVGSHGSQLLVEPLTLIGDEGTAPPVG